MICYLNGQKIDLKTNMKNFLGSGVEGKVFRYQDIAIKIYHDYVIIRKREIRDNVYKNIQTTKIITPDDLVTDLYGNYIGYSQKLIPKKTLFSKTSVDLQRQNIINNFRLLEDDSLTFAKNFVLMDGVTHNVVDNGTLYFIDTGSYEIVTLDTIKDNQKLSKELGIENDENITNEKLEYRLKIKNLDTCYVAIWNNIERNIKFSNKKLKKLKRRLIKDLDQASENSRISSILNDYMKPDDTIRTLVKRM